MSYLYAKFRNDEATHALRNGVSLCGIDSHVTQIESASRDLVVFGDLGNCCVRAAAREAAELLALVAIPSIGATRTVPGPNGTVLTVIGENTVGDPVPLRRAVGACVHMLDAIARAK